MSDFRRHIALGRAFCLVAALSAGGLRAVSVNQALTWSSGDPEGWQLVNEATGSYENGRLEVVNGKLTWGYEPGEQNTYLSVEAAEAASSGALFGDLYDNGATSVQVKIYSSVHTVFKLELWHKTDFSAYHAEINLVPGWQTFQLSLDTDSFSPLFGTPDGAAFTDLLQNVGRVWLGAQRNPGASGEQVFKLEHVNLAGSEPGYTEWIQGFGGTWENRIPAEDWSHNGMLNSEAYSAGLDPTDASAKLRLSIQGPAVTLRFLSAENRFYEIWRAPSPGGEFVRIQSAIPGTGEIILLPDPGAGSLDHAIYKIGVSLSP